MDVPADGKISTEVLIVGSGAGGAVTAATLAEAGIEVLVAEEGPKGSSNDISTNSPRAMRTLYRQGGLSPILGNANIALVEGCCVGGSTEINSAFWHRTPPAAINRWHAYYAVCDLTMRDLNGLFDEIEQELEISLADSKPAPNSELFRIGAEKLGWKVERVPTAMPKDDGTNQFSPGAKRSMSRTYVPRAIRAGARLLANFRIRKLHTNGGRIDRVTGSLRLNEREVPVEVRAESIFVCGGTIQTPTLLRASGIKRNVGDNLHIHPMLKMAAEFDERIDAHRSPLPVYQIKEFAPEITLGGSVFTPGFLALTLSENWSENQHAMKAWRNMALYYTACRGSNAGTVRLFPLTREPWIRYNLTRQDQVNLSVGMARLGEILLAAGARRLYPGLRSPAVLSSLGDCQAFLRQPIPLSEMSLSTVHMFGTCPMGEDHRVCVTNSFGKVHGLDNLYISDASVIPDALGVNPQGTVMALALRNARHFIQERTV